MAGTLDGKVALITGGARGMGEAEVRLFAAQGASVVFGDVLDADGQALAKAVPGTTYVHLDVSSEADWAAAVKLVLERHGRIDVLVNNAGILRGGPIEEMSVADFELVFRINQLGPFLGMRAVIPHMKKAGRGSIVNISSTAGMQGYPNLVAYAGSKHAVRGMTKVAALELARHNVRVNSVHPGMVATPMTLAAGDAALAERASRTTFGRAGTPDEVANLVAFLASDASSYCSGSEFIVDGASTAGPAEYMSISMAAKDAART
jgi:3alpha(or 20beta)-hydroxysteroid dehydrogenase